MTPHYIDRFWSKVSFGEKNDCWNWTAYKCNKGYGQFSVDGKVLKAHRVAWELSNGPIVNDGSYHGTCVCHKCDNPSCCNPNHLFLGTNQDNVDDMVEKGRQSRTKLPGILHGRSKLTESQVLEIRSLYTTGNYTQDKLGVMFGVDQSLISVIVNRKNWSHI